VILANGMRREFSHLIFCDICQSLIQSSNGAELCASYQSPAPAAQDCVSAYDETFRGRVDLSHLVTVGEPIKKSALRWSVPYNVHDAAGNAAVTVYRDVVVEQVDLTEVEQKVRMEDEQYYQTKLQLAVDAAVAEERKKQRDLVAVVETCEKNQAVDNCPACDCPFNAAKCHEICTAKIEHCAVDMESTLVQLVLWLDQVLPLSSALLLLVCTAFVLFLVVLRWILTLVFNPRALLSPPVSHYATYDEQQRAILNSVTHYRDGRFVSSPLAPTNVSNVFTPHENGSAGRLFGSEQPTTSASRTEPPSARVADIYLSPKSIITPGQQNRTPFSR
jgi:hypothetical protein